MELNEYEKKSLIALLSKMNRYEMMAILCKTYESENEMELAINDLLKIYLKLTNLV